MKVLVNLEPGRGWGYGKASKQADKQLNNYVVDHYLML